MVWRTRLTSARSFSLHREKKVGNKGHLLTGSGKPIRLSSVINIPAEKASALSRHQSSPPRATSRGAKDLKDASLNQDSLPTTLPRLLLRSQASCSECAPLLAPTPSEGM